MQLKKSVGALFERASLNYSGFPKKRLLKAFTYSVTLVYRGSLCLKFV